MGGHSHDLLYTCITKQLYSPISQEVHVLQLDALYNALQIQITDPIISLSV